LKELNQGMVPHIIDAAKQINFETAEYDLIEI